MSNTNSKNGIGETRKTGTILKLATALTLATATLNASADAVTLAWDASPDANAVGYTLYSSTDGVKFDTSVDVGSNTVAVVSNLVAGSTNYFEVAAYDSAGDESPTTPSLMYVVPGGAQNTNQNNVGSQNGNTNQNNGGSTNQNGNGAVGSQSGGNSSFALLTSGNGSISPKRGSKPFVNGQKYTSVAVPAKGSVFAGWTSNGLTVATGTRYTFIVLSNVVVQANFVTNPFVPVIGNYRGLIYVASNAAPESSGAFTAAVTSSGSFTAKVQMGGHTYSYAQAFSLTGAATKTIIRQGATPLSVQLQLGLTNGPLIGTVSDGTWTADLVADPLVYSHNNPAPEAGKYTMVIPGSTNDSQPGGNGFGAVTVTSSGSVVFSGVLGDGTHVVSTSIVTSEGQWPLYASLYAGKGSILGWLAFTNTGDINGETGWFKLPQAKAQSYPGGFTNSANVIGSAYRSGAALSSANAQLSLANGNLTDNTTNQVTIGNGAGQNKVSVSPATGLFKTTVTNPATGKPMVVSGAILQNQNAGAGLFLGSPETGSAVLVAIP